MMVAVVNIGLGQPISSLQCHDLLTL